MKMAGDLEFAKTQLLCLEKEARALRIAIHTDAQDEIAAIFPSVVTRVLKTETELRNAGMLIGVMK